VSFSSDFTLNFFIYAVIALSLYHAAFMCEAIRSGVNTVPLGQAEAARSIGLGFLPAARHVILPQALRGAITPLGNTVIALTKNTTVAAAASVAEASGLMKRMIEFSRARRLGAAEGQLLVRLHAELLHLRRDRALALPRGVHVRGDPL
ncbi:ABC transporter permease subunit, partial [Corynebacterium diphtheriae]